MNQLRIKKEEKMRSTQSSAIEQENQQTEVLLCNEAKEFAYRFRLPKFNNGQERR